MDIKKELKELADTKQAIILSRFFKTGKGEYGEGDKFLGIKVPVQRKVARRYKDMPLKDVEKLLQSEYHEHRLTALFILIHQYDGGDDRKKIVDIYRKNLKHVNNWDLVDLSAPKILGEYLFDKDRKPLYGYARSDDLWERRVAILSTFTFIRNHEFDDALNIAEILLDDKHDLIHKAVGWMLREVGNRDLEEEEKFLKKHYKTMPRTMLRYSIEKFDTKKKAFYMKK